MEDIMRLIVILFVILVTNLPTALMAHDRWENGWDDNYRSNHNSHRGWNRVVREPQIGFRGDDHVVIELPRQWAERPNPPRFFRQKPICNKPRFFYSKPPVTYAPARRYDRGYIIINE